VVSENFFGENAGWVAGRL